MVRAGELRFPPVQDRYLALGYPEVPSCRPATLSARPDWSGPHHGLGSRRELHPAPTHPPTALVRVPCDHRGLPRPPAGSPGLHSAVASAASAAGEPWPCPRSPLWLLATRRGLVCHSHQDASGEEVQQCPVWRSDRLSLLLPAVPLGTSHGGGLRLSREAPGDAAVPGRSGHLVCRVGGLKELRRLPGLQGDWGHQQGKRQPLHSHRSRPGLTVRPQPRHVIGVAFSLAFTLGPMLGAFLPAEMVPWLALLFAASDLLFIFCFLPETLPAEKRASSIGPGFQAAADLLSPVALLRFSAVARGQDPPAGDGIRHLRRLGLVYFLYLFLFSGLEFTLSFLAHQRFQFSSLQQGKMFFFIGLTMATVQGAYARKISPGSEIAAVKRAILLLVPAFLLIGWGLTLPALGLGLLLYSFGPPGGRRPASTSRLPPPLPQRLAQAEGHDHGHTSEPGRPGQGSGTHGGRLSVLAGRGQGLLHGVLRPLPAPFPAPAQPEASSPHGTQGRVVELAPPQAGGGGGEGNGTSRLPLGPSPGPCQTLQQLRGTRLGSPARRAGSRDSPTPFRFCVHFSLRHTVSAKPPNDKIKQLFYTKCLSPAHGCASLPPTWETPEHQKLLHLH
ncbi:major facilitator superfamily domain-containing protein 10 isoform X3 [Panthera pardus]|uniref:Major facilitator superfamily domain-containing protein 10 isoform X3 n=1 Tax=Panthera pardus TaxID=9691 RepID=A0A9W2VGG2_PANPR|nr:major facilitator superfamily domain-containing protein 10 isoform X3 [Panthera pardus]